MANGDNTGFKRIYNAFFYSLNGLKAAYKNEAAFRQELILSTVLIPLGLWLGQTGLEKALLVTVVLLVLIVELLNTGIETLVDRISREHHELSGMAKDVGSAAVLLSLFNVLVVWILVLVF